MIRHRPVAGSERTEMARALVIDSSKDIRYLIRGILETSGLEVTEACSGDAGIEALRKGQSDLVVIDSHVAAEPCSEAIRKIRRRSPDAKVIVLTTFGNEAFSLIEDFGANAAFLKPFRVREFLRCVENLLRPDGSGESE